MPTIIRRHHPPIHLSTYQPTRAYSQPTTSYPPSKPNQPANRSLCTATAVNSYFPFQLEINQIKSIPHHTARQSVSQWWTMDGAERISVYRKQSISVHPWALGPCADVSQEWPSESRRLAIRLLVFFLLAWWNRFPIPFCYLPALFFLSAFPFSRFHDAHATPCLAATINDPYYQLSLPSSLPCLLTRHPPLVHLEPAIDLRSQDFMFHVLFTFDSLMLEYYSTHARATIGLP